MKDSSFKVLFFLCVALFVLSLWNVSTMVRMRRPVNVFDDIISNLAMPLLWLPAAFTLPKFVRWTLWGVGGAIVIVMLGRFIRRLVDMRRDRACSGGS